MEEKESKTNATQNAESESLFRKEYLTKASDLFAALDTMERRWSGQQIKHYSAEYQKRVTQMIGEFRQVLKRHALFDCPSGLWAYSIVIRGRGIFLYLEHYQVSGK